MKNWKPIFWSSIRFLLVLLLPIYINAQLIRGSLQNFSYYCLLMRIFPQDIFLDPFYSVWSILYRTMLLGAVILISAPLIYFELNLRRMPPENSAKASAFVLLLVSTFLFAFLNYFLVDINHYFWIMFDVEMAFTWSVIVFVVFPLLVRETRLLEFHRKKGEPTREPKRYRPSKYSIFGYILALIVSIWPYSYRISTTTDRTYSAIDSISFIITQSEYLIYENSVAVYPQNYFVLSFNSLMILINICFCIYLLRFFKGDADRTKVFVIGLAGVSAPFLLFTYNAIISNYTNLVIGIPFPLLLITGLILLKITPIVKADESIWMETPKRMWFEGPQEIEEERVPIVNVPFKYIIISRLRKWRSQQFVEEEL